MSKDYNLNFSLLKNLKHTIKEDEHIISLIDIDGQEIIIGYGNSIESALNDLHHNLL